MGFNDRNRVDNWECMKNYYLALAATYLASAQAGADKMTNDLRNRAHDKWEKSKLLPRKQKKLMRKDAALDYEISCWTNDYSNYLFL